MRWSRRHPLGAWIGTVALLACLFLGVSDVGMRPTSNLAVAITVACAVALIVGDIAAMLVHRWHRLRR